MFFQFEILVKSHIVERVELIVSTPKEAINLFFLFEESPRVIAWKFISHKPEDLGCAPGNSKAWKKYRSKEPGFKQEDFE